MVPPVADAVFPARVGGVILAFLLTRDIAEAWSYHAVCGREVSRADTHALSIRIITLRNRVRRPFTVEAKSSGQARSVFIPSKQPREPRKRIEHAEAAAPWPSSDAAAFTFQALNEAAQAPHEHRRILPSLLVAEVHEPERERAIEPEERPRVPRVAPVTAPTDGVPRRRGRPRKVPVQDAVGMAEEAVPEPPQPVVEIAPIILRRRPGRAGSEKLRLGERWKRRLPKACW